MLLCLSQSRHADMRYEQRQEVNVDLCAEIKLPVVCIHAGPSTSQRFAGLPDDHDHSQNFCSHLACCEIAARAQHPQRIAHQLCQRKCAVSRLADSITICFIACDRQIACHLLPLPDEDSFVMCSSTHFAFLLALSNDSTKF